MVDFVTSVSFHRHCLRRRKFCNSASVAISRNRGCEVIIKIPAKILEIIKKWQKEVFLLLLKFHFFQLEKKQKLKISFDIVKKVEN